MSHTINCNNLKTYMVSAITVNLKGVDSTLFHETKMRSLIRLSLIAITATLCACSSVKPPSVTPPEASEEAFRLEASGEQVFRCLIDARGWYWKFEAPNAYLFDPLTNQAVAKHGYNFTFVHNDGSCLTTRIVSTAPQGKKDLSDALFTVASRDGYGRLSQIQYVQRLNAKGGVPTTMCTKEKRGQLARVPFTADFIFYRQGDRMNNSLQSHF